MFSLKSFASLLTLASLALAHGSTSGCEVDGRRYPGSTFIGNPARSPIRRLSNQGEPIIDVNSNTMICGVGAARAPVSAAARPGSRIEVYWHGQGSTNNWFHKDGPMISYITRCPGDCRNFTPTANTNWYKFGQQGQKTPGRVGGWYQEDLLRGAPSVMTLPDNLPNGNYLIRHEIITLQRATTRGLAEFYPNCIQVTVTGGSSGNFSASPAVHFPGAYRAGDPGILVDAYTPTNRRYVIPGGPIATFRVAGGNEDETEDASTTSSSAGPASTAAPTCRRRRAAKARRAVKRALENHKRRGFTTY